VEECAEVGAAHAAEANDGEAHAVDHRSEPSGAQVVAVAGQAGVAML
jgi:hypothetical protein